MRRSFATVLSTAALLISTLAARAADDDAKSVITRAIKAHGGEERLTMHSAARMENKGKITLPGVGETDFTQQVAYMLPDKLRESLDLTINGQTITVLSIVNGEKVSIEANGQAVPVNDQAKTAIQDAMNMLTIARLSPLLKNPGYELALIGESKVEDKPAVGVRVSAKGQKDISLFFDKKTNLLAKIERRTTPPNSETEVTEERIIQEYQQKDKDSFPFPKKVLIRHDGKTYLSCEVTHAEYLEKIDESEFKK